ncbi:hypothetical protein BLOT_008318 [Blomia tropicalis]|nr:hypothetical protein BLOT_008318 [Blomia tropicalis]
MTSYFIQGDDLTKNETKQLRKPLMNSEFYEPDVNTETNLQSPKPENRYTNFDESVTPSPGTVSEFMEHFMSGDDQSSRVKFDSTDLTDSSETSSYHSSTTKPLVVPVGSRVHTIHYRDYDGNSVHEEQQFVSPLEKYEPKVIELESSRPILPIVINFHTKSSPVIATQTHYKPPNTVPKVQYFETNEPPHYHRHIVHKPIYQNLREIILPYRFLTQEIRPVQEYRQTYVPKWVNRHNRGPQYHSMGSMLSNQFHGNNFKPITPFLQEYRQMGPMSYLRNNRYHFMQQQQQQQKQHSPMSYNNMLNQNPYFKIPNWNKMPYRIQDLYQNHINKF